MQYRTPLLSMMQSCPKESVVILCSGIALARELALAGSLSFRFIFTFIFAVREVFRSISIRQLSETTERPMWRSSTSVVRTALEMLVLAMES